MEVMFWCEDGDGGGEAATGRTITDEVASVLEAACRARWRATRAHEEEGFRNLTPRYAPELLRMSAPTPCKL